MDNYIPLFIKVYMSEQPTNETNKADTNSNRVDKVFYMLWNSYQNG